jgi:hypothetical protein
MDPRLWGYIKRATQPMDGAKAPWAHDDGGRADCLKGKTQWRNRMGD